jgi:ABC-2 type transport system permease protein
MKFTFLIMKRLFRQLSRDHRTVGLVLVAPILFVVMYGIAFGGEIEHVPIAIINQDSDAHVLIQNELNMTIYNETVPSLGHKITSTLDTEDSRVDVHILVNRNEATERVDDKVYTCLIFIPENFTYNLVSPIGENLSLEIYFDNSNPQVGVVVLQAIREAFQEAIGNFRGNLGFDISYAYGEGISTLDFFTPAMIVFGIFFLSFILVVMNLIGERKFGTLSLLLQCPYDKIEIILGYLIAFSVLSMIQTTLIILVAGIVFQVSFGTTLAHYLSIYFASIVVGWTALVLAIFLSAFARSEFQAVQFIPIIIIPILLLSGIIIPLSQIPEIIRWVSYLLPTTYAVQLLRQIAIEGYILELWNFGLLYQLGFFVVALIGSRLTLRET